MKVGISTPTIFKGGFIPQKSYFFYRTYDFWVKSI